MAMTTAYCCVLALLVQGERLDPLLSEKLMDLVKAGDLPFHAVTADRLQPPTSGDPDPRRAGRFSSPDALLTPSYMAVAAGDPDIRIEPAWKVSLVYGMPCAIYHQLPAAYYLAARFSTDFEQAVLHALNGGRPESGALHPHRGLGWRAGGFDRHSATLFGWAGECVRADGSCPPPRGTGAEPAVAGSWSRWSRISCRSRTEPSTGTYRGHPS